MTEAWETTVQGSEARRVGDAPHPASPGGTSAGTFNLKREVSLAALSIVVCAGILLLVWEAVVLAGVFPSIVLATPLQVWQSFGTELGTGDLVVNTAVTLREALLGFILAAVVASPVAYLIVQLRVLDLLLTPFVAAAQGVPAVAVAPIILLVLSGNLLPKVVICATVVIFPLLVTMVTGLRSVGREYRDVARVFGASRLQMLWHVELPLSSPVLLSGVKLGVTLSITGAVVAEFVASDAGLGFMVNTAINSFEVSTRYVAVITLAALSALFFGSITLIERIVDQWLAID
jgi:NitT/TauT family transport system permease protein